VDKRRLEDITPMDFFYEYVYVVLNSGMNNKIAEKMYRKLLSEGSKTVNHLGKRKAIIRAQIHYKWWFRQLKSCATVNEKLDFLETLPWIGPITKHHLARNLGIDVAKPDRHLQRIAKHFEYFDVQKMCNNLSLTTGDRIGTVDVILWRICNLNPPWRAKETVPGW